MKNTLSLKELAFVSAFMGAARGNATRAAKEAGYGGTAASSRQLGYRLLTKVHIQRALVKRAQRLDALGIADAVTRDTILSKIARDEHADVFARISAIRELNRCSGRHSIRHQLDASERLSDIIAASRGQA